MPDQSPPPADPVTAEDELYASITGMNRGLRRNGAGFFEALGLTAFYCVVSHRLNAEAQQGTDGS